MILKKPTLNYIRNMVHQSEGTSKIDKDFIAEIIKADIAVIRTGSYVESVVVNSSTL